MMIMSHKMILKIMTLYIKRWQLKLVSFIKDARTEWVKLQVALCLRFTYFSFQNKYQLQVHGATMGSPVSPIQHC